ncbi:MAG: ATP-dependent Clp protease ATP-binding subunit ClpA, partial [Bradyrhizobium sp.]|nr:ATP-dependent Clp protease ATP-binding subunit ClpA [Bradyrhizobium sp.]
GDDHEAINRQFAPEFRNRLDAIISFAHLNADVIGMVVEKFVLQLEAQLADRDVTIELSEPAKAWLIQHGYDEQMGARPMARVIQEHIKKPLADQVLFGSLKGGGHVRVVLVKDEASLEPGQEKIGFEYVEGPVTPKPEKLPGARKRTPPRKPKPGGPPSGGSKGPVSKGPLVKV